MLGLSPAQCLLAEPGCVPVTCPAMVRGFLGATGQITKFVTTQAMGWGGTAQLRHLER